MKPFYVSKGKGAKMRGKTKWSKWMLKDMQSHSLTQVNYWTDYRCRIPDKADSKRQGHRQPHSHHSDLEGRDPQKQIPPVTHYNDFQDTAHTQIPCTLQRGTRYQVHHTWEEGNWNKKSFLAGINGDKIYTCRLLYVCVCFMYEFVYKHVLNQIPLSPAVALWDSIPPTLNRAGFVLLSQ